MKKAGNLLASCFLAGGAAWWPFTEGHAEGADELFDGTGRPSRSYRVDSIFPEGFILRTADKSLWVDAPVTDPQLRERIFRNQRAKIDLPAPKSGRLGSPPAPSGLPGVEVRNLNTFTFSPSHDSRQRAVVSAAVSIAQAQEKIRIDEVVKGIPGANAAREMPWDFVRNEAGMLAVWFSVDGRKSADDAAVERYIKEQHSLGNLLYRLLIRPWFSKKEERP